MTLPSDPRKSTEEIAKRLYGNVGACGEKDCNNCVSEIKQALDTERSVFAPPHANFEEYRKAWEDLDNERKETIADLQKEVERLKKEIHDFRSIDRHKDKDWDKWYGLYHAKVDEISSLKAEVERLKQPITVEGSALDIVRLSEENTALKASVVEKEAHIKEAEELITALRGGAQDVIVELENKITRLTTELEELKLEPSKFYHVENLEKKIATLEGDLAYKVCDLEYITEEYKEMKAHTLLLIEALKKIKDLSWTIGRKPSTPPKPKP